MQDNRAQNVVDEPSDDDIAALLDNAPDSPHTALRSLLRNAFSRIGDAEQVNLQLRGANNTIQRLASDVAKLRERCRDLSLRKLAAIEDQA